MFAQFRQTFNRPDGSGTAKLAEIVDRLFQAGLIDRPGDVESSGWITNYEYARSVARQSGKPMFVVFR